MSTQLNEGMTLGHTYRLLHRIGSGGMGEVWCAEHTRLPRQFAVKVLYGAAAANETTLSRFRREAEIASRLGHPNIVQVFDFNTLEDGTPYMVMELLQGESLRERAQRGPLPLEQVIHLLRQVAAALREAHRQGVIHRDLKPDNVFICDEEHEGQRYERVKVLDFGISKIQGSQTVVTRDAEVLGTPLYMAPEQAAGRHTLVDGRTDEFALAAIAYELLSGQIAFSGETLVEVIHKIMNGSPPPLRSCVPNLPEHVFAAIERGLAKEPTARFPQITDFVAALAQDAGDRSPEQPPERSEQSPENVNEAVQNKAVQSDQHHQAILPTAISQHRDAPANPLGATALSHDPLELPERADLSTPGLSQGPSSADGSERSLPISLSQVQRGRTRRVVLLAVSATILFSILIAIGALIVFKSTKSSDRKSNRSNVERPTWKTHSASAVDAQATVDRSHRSDLAMNDRSNDLSTAENDLNTVEPKSPQHDGAPSAASHRTESDRKADSKRATRNLLPPKTIHQAQPAEDVPQDVVLAEQALDRGDTHEALYLARRSLRHQRAPRAYVVMVHAFCIKQDLRMAKAMLLQLNGPMRRQAVRWCMQRGFDISP